MGFCLLVCFCFVWGFVVVVVLSYLKVCYTKKGYFMRVVICVTCEMHLEGHRRVTDELIVYN